MIFRDSLMSFLGLNERAKADDGYVGESPLHIKCPNSFTNDKSGSEMQQRIHPCHETVHKRFK